MTEAMSLSAHLKAALRHQSHVMASITGTTGAEAVITVDDGPDAVETPKVLRVLEDHRARATFFMLLSRARLHPGLVNAVRDAGHEVALHGPDHRPLTDFSFSDALSRTRAARTELEDIAECRVRWFRPPYGRQTPKTWLATRAAGLTPVLWSGTTWDWKDVSMAERLTKAFSTAQPGVILLTHDGIAGQSDGAEDAPPALEHRAALMDAVLHEYRSRGLHGVSLGDALGACTPVRRMVFTSLRAPRARQ